MKLYQPQLNGRTLRYFRKLIFYLLAYKEAIVSLFGFVIPVLGLIQHGFIACNTMPFHIMHLIV